MKLGGTGGANTNRGGLEFEKNTDLSARIVRDLSDSYRLNLITVEPSALNSKDPVYEVIRLADYKKIGYITKQFQFYNVMKNEYGVENQNHKKWKPDEVFFNLETNTVFIVEKKWQQGAGSVDEKIFGFVNKRRLYQLNFNVLNKEPKPTVEFLALFNADWWLHGNNGKNMASYQDYFDNLRIDGIKIFFDEYDYWWFGLK
ncbi:PD-(D/E)XK nuclease superfamily protein [Periweissella fabalis]|uniref:PD-(D/E)XK nuclease superfamily protein n=1 Tax=Periweissella fabalis TaxID=1070421 RepID=UPI001FEAFEA1|nr:PD-(D/E)XK nuclease superfamily protein [Periweissella fabalis]